MEGLVKDVIPLLQYLIPGFLTAWIFYSLTAFKRPDTFGQIVQALIFTFLIQGTVYLVGEVSLLVGKHVGSIGVWDGKAQTVCAGIVAALIGLLSCYLANSDRLHGWLRDKGITKQTSFPNEWFSAFSSHKRFVVLHLVDERRLYGWPSEWPSEPSSGQFVINDPSWLDDTGQEKPLAAELLVIEASKVQWVEFTQQTW
ncbi:DUF6338 family protein [Pseudomonas coronafaciens]|uniref:DUF6338 family protein n=1 Tax=Pseudomonas coronafaciens TaxID=53409 RepID=UPI0005A4D8C7|nr:DUF6338 family protein [Pseudomonas coronafaciens]KGS15121.1 prophage PssSM-03 [Pseudomonas coronafaciens]RMV07174.1 hypothetical protein ALP20_03346 [Pseudomonas coronafaciens pv. coronafaciens]